VGICKIQNRYCGNFRLQPLSYVSWNAGYYYVSVYIYRERERERERERVGIGAYYTLT